MSGLFENLRPSIEAPKKAGARHGDQPVSSEVVVSTHRMHQVTEGWMDIDIALTSFAIRTSTLRSGLVKRCTGSGDCVDDPAIDPQGGAGRRRRLSRCRVDDHVGHLLARGRPLGDGGRPPRLHECGGDLLD